VESLLLLLLETLADRSRGVMLVIGCGGDDANENVGGGKKSV